MKHTLVLMRHGKSAYPHGVPDHDRPLAPRGLRQAKLSGEWVNKHVGPFDLILCSTATRTRQTLEQAGLVGPVQSLQDLYDEDHQVYLDIIAAHGGDAKKIALVGHQPAIAATALALAENRDSKPAQRLEEKFPTAAVAVLEGRRPFSGVETGHMTLTHFHVPERDH